MFPRGPFLATSYIDMQYSSQAQQTFLAEAVAIHKPRLRSFEDKAKAIHYGSSNLSCLCTTYQDTFLACK